MHDQLRNVLSDAIDAMTEVEKLELIEELAHSLRASTNRLEQPLTPAIKQQMLEGARRIASLPMEGPGGFSGCDHDQVLYGAPSKRNPPA